MIEWGNICCLGEDALWWGNSHINKMMRKELVNDFIPSSH